MWAFLKNARIIREMKRYFLLTAGVISDTNAENPGLSETSAKIAGPPHHPVNSPLGRNQLEDEGFAKGLIYSTVF